MNTFDPYPFSRRAWLQAALFSSAFPLSTWANARLNELEEEEDDENDEAKYATRLETTLIGDKTNYSEMRPVVLEGVGLIRGLSGTGGDPEPNQYRTALLEDLKKDGYKNPNTIISSPNTALALCRAYLKPLVKKGERLDVEIVIPPGANATSLVGGELLEVRLSDKAFVDGRYMRGTVYAIARGFILPAGLGASASKEPALLRRGRILGGAVVLKERELALTLKNDFIMIRNSKRIETAIGRRFHDFDEHGIKKPMATAKTDQRLTLKVHPRYKDNHARYLNVVRHLAFYETPVEQRVRMGFLKRDLSIPDTASSAAMQLEAIGRDGIPILKTGLKAPLLECRFHSAMALAYLGDSSGLPALVEAAKERAFRVYALAAIAVLEDADAHLALRDLMNESVDELRYGAFRALWTLDRNDPFIRGELLGVREDAENHDNEYKMHVLRTSGPPLIHVTQRTRPEIVLFGLDQEFSAPFNGSAGKHIMVHAAPGSTTMSLARFEVGKPDQRKEVSLRVADVIRAADEMGANYPDIVQLLADASKQKSIPTPIAVEKLPEAGRVYYRPVDGDKSKGPRAIRIGKDNFSPNMYPDIDDPDELARRKDQVELDNQKSGGNSTMASVPTEPVASDSETDTDTKPAKSKSKSSTKSDKTKWPWSRGK